MKYYGLEIYKRGGTTTLWVTSDKAWRPDTTTAYKFMWRGTSTDDFATDGSWTALPRDNGDTPNDIAGPNNPPQPFWGINNGLRLAGHRSGLHRQRHQREPGRSRTG